MQLNTQEVIPCQICKRCSRARAASKNYLKPSSITLLPCSVKDAPTKSTIFSAKNIPSSKPHIFAPSSGIHHVTYSKNVFRQLQQPPGIDDSLNGITWRVGGSTLASLVTLPASKGMSIWHAFCDSRLRRIKPVFPMGAVAKRLLRGSTAPA